MSQVWYFRSFIHSLTEMLVWASWQTRADTHTNTHVRIHSQTNITPVVVYVLESRVSVVANHNDRQENMILSLKATCPVSAQDLRSAVFFLTFPISTIFAVDNSLWIISGGVCISIGTGASVGDEHLPGGTRASRTISQYIKVGLFCF